MGESTFHQRLGAGAAVLLEQALFHRAGVYPNANDRPVGLGGIHHAVHVFLGADIAGVDAQAFKPGLQRGHGKTVIKMYVRNERPGAYPRGWRAGPQRQPRPGTATRTASQPRASSRAICASVASASRVSVLVMLCTITGAPPPMESPPDGWRGLYACACFPLKNIMEPRPKAAVCRNPFFYAISPCKPSA